MNLSRSFFEESSVWDPKIIRQHLSITQDDLNKLNSIPDWTKKQSNCRADKDFSIGNSQPLVNLSENDVGIRQQNIQLFDEHLQNRKSILKKSKEYTDKLNRCISLFDIHKTSDNTLNCFPLKRASSLPVLYLLSDSSEINYFDKSSKHSSKYHSPSHSEESLECRVTENNTSSGEIKTIVPKPDQSEVLFCDRISIKKMEVISQLPLNISNHIESVASETVKENELLTDHTKNSDQHICVNESSKSNDASKDEEVSNLVESPTPLLCKNDEIDQVTTDTKESANVNSAFENSKNSNIQEVAETHILTNISTFSPPSEIIPGNVILPVADENVKVEKLENDAMEGIAEEETELHVTSDQTSVSETIVRVVSSIGDTSDKLNLCVQGLEKTKFVECPESSVSTKEQCISKEAIISDPKYEDQSCNSNRKADVESAQKPLAKYDSAKHSLNLEAGSGKRKLESKYKKSKKQKSEEKKGNLKIRSIKKVGEVCYCIEDVKTMLDIMKKFI